MSSENKPSFNRDEPTVYHIRIKGHLNDKWSDWFDGVTIILEPNSTTLLSSSVIDQPALYGLLRKVRDLGMPLISVKRIDPDNTAPPNIN